MHDFSSVHISIYSYTHQACTPPNQGSAVSRNHAVGFRDTVGTLPVIIHLNLLLCYPNYHQESSIPVREKKHRRNRKEEKETEEEGGRRRAKEAHQGRRTGEEHNQDQAFGAHSKIYKLLYYAILYIVMS